MRTLILDKEASLEEPGHATLGENVFYDRMNAEPLVEVGENEKKFVNRGKYWFQQMRAERFHKVVFDPTMPPGANGKIWNTWKGFPVVPQPGDWSKLDAHVFEVIAGGDEAAYNWIMNWMAWGVQNPGALIGTMPVLKGLPGTGKGVFVNEYGALWAPHFITLTHREQVFGKFSGHYFGVRFVFIDEGYYAGDKKNAGTMKARVTEQKMMFERKGENAFQGENRMIQMLATNEAHAMPADSDERRWMILNVAPTRKLDRNWFGGIKHQMDNEGGRAAFLHSLLTRDLSVGPNPQFIFRGKALFGEMLGAASPEVQYLHHLLNSGVLPKAREPEPNLTSAAALWADFKLNFVPTQFQNSANLSQQILRTLPGIVQSQATRSWLLNIGGTHRSMLYAFPKLSEARAEFVRRLGADEGIWDNEAADWQADSELPFG